MDKGYTKHYFEEGKRICSKIGSGGLIEVGNIIEGISQGIEEIRDIQREGVERTFDMCMQLHPYIKTNNLHKTVVKPYEGQINPGEPIFYYHSDHLGSASFLTDTNGIETQQLVYLPFGEDWVDMKYNTSQYDTPYKFNGKEKDSETGYNNYGARYYYDWASIWLSVDPMSDKYPHLTSYNYCANNPVMLIDPDGRDPREAGNIININGHKFDIKVIHDNKKHDSFNKRINDQAMWNKFDRITTATGLVGLVSKSTLLSTVLEAITPGFKAKEAKVDRFLDASVSNHYSMREKISNDYYIDREVKNLGKGFESEVTLRIDYKRDKNGDMSPDMIKQYELTKDKKKYKITTTTFNKDGKATETIEYKKATPRKNNTNYE